jgi:hypothetical protein
MSAARIAMRVWGQSGADAELLPGLISAAFDQIDSGYKGPVEHPDVGRSDDGKVRQDTRSRQEV